MPADQVTNAELYEILAFLKEHMLTKEEAYEVFVTKKHLDERLKQYATKSDLENMETRIITAVKESVDSHTVRLDRQEKRLDNHAGRIDRLEAEAVG